MLPRGHAGRAALDGPTVPVPMRYLIDWWHEIGSGRGAGGFGPAAITWGDIAAWARVTQTPVTGAEAVVVLRMDRAFLGAAMPPERKQRA